MRRSMARKALIYVFSIIFVAFLIIPVVEMIITSLKFEVEIWRFPPTVIPENPTLSNFIEMWEHVELERFLLNSFIYGIGVGLLSVAIALPTAYALSRFEIWGSGFLRIGIVYTNMFAPINLLIPLFVMMRFWGLVNTYWSVIIAGSIFTIPFSVWLLTAYFESIPKDIEEAALVDGCTRRMALLRVIIPLAIPGVLTTLTYCFITGWSHQFTLSLVLIRDLNMQPITLGLYMFFTRNIILWGNMMAALIVSTIIPVTMFLIIQKWIIKGMTAGAIKL